MCDLLDNNNVIFFSSNFVFYLLINLFNFIKCITTKEHGKNGTLLDDFAKKKGKK